MRQEIYSPGLWEKKLEILEDYFDKGWIFVAEQDDTYILTDHGRTKYIKLIFERPGKKGDIL